MGTQVRGFLRLTFANHLDTEFLQTSLLGLGYHPGPVDGQFDVSVERAVVAFQKDAGLTPDGMVGGETWAALAAPVKSKKEEKVAAVVAAPAPVVRSAGSKPKRKTKKS
jgi:peptidoglycan hydrolase-like protein with peptidoglycan-binding domain